MANPQEVISFIKHRGGSTTLSEIRHFSLQVVQFCVDKQLIKISKSPTSGYQVKLLK